jgi:small subunit ribosomal protein S1
LKVLLLPKHLVTGRWLTSCCRRKDGIQSNRIQQGTKRIILSHSRIFEDEQKGAKKEAAAGEKKPAAAKRNKKEEEANQV